jgi:hypothetical protein
MEQSQRHPSLVLDLLILAIAAGLLLASSKLGLRTGHPATTGTGAIFGGVYIVYLGLLFLLSYFFPRHSYTFSLLAYVCQECSRPAGRWMAWFYFALSAVIGSILLLIGFGIL